MKKLVYAVLLLCIMQAVHAQRLQNGLIMPTEYAQSGNAIYIAKQGFPIYNSPNGTKIGLLSTTEEYKVSLIQDQQYHDVPIDRTHFQMIGYEVFALLYHRRERGFVKVLGIEDNYWIKIEDLMDRHFVLVEWSDFIMKSAITYYPNDPGLNLRDQPSIEGNKIVTMKGNNFSIKPLSEKQGLWMKVRVTKYKYHPMNTQLSEEENLDYIYEGWTKIVDDSGTPNVYFNPKGC